MTPVCRSHLRLIEQFEFVTGQRVLEAGFERAPGEGAAIQVRFEEMEPARAELFGAIQRHVGVLQERLGIVAVGREHTDADTHTDADLMAVHLMRLRDRADHRPGDRGRILRVSEL